jgi:hypothetical protein
MQQDVEKRDRLVAGRLLLKLEYPWIPCTYIVLAREHHIGQSTIAEIQNRLQFLSQDEKNQAIQAATDFYASRAQVDAQFAGIIIP